MSKTVLSRRVIQAIRALPLTLGSAVLSGCDVYYEFHSGANDTGRLLVAPSTYLWDLGFLALILAVALGYPAFYRNVTHKEIGGRRLFALRGLLGLIFVAFFFTRTWYNLNHYWEANPDGIKEVSIYREQSMSWDDAYRVWADRQNRRDVTKEMSVAAPMFHVIGPDNQAIIVRGEEVGFGPFEEFASFALELYYRRPVLWKARPKPEGSADTGTAAPADAPPGEAPAATPEGAVKPEAQPASPESPAAPAPSPAP